MYMKRVKAFSFLLPIFLSLLFLGANSSLSEITVTDTGDSIETRYGSHIDSEGWVHFVVFSPDATGVNLLLFDKGNAKTPKHVIPMKKGGNDWKIRIRGQDIGVGL